MMRLLLDTCALLWFLTDDAKLSVPAKAAIEDPVNERWLSPASLREIALKARLGKLPLHRPFGALFPKQLTDNDIHLLPLEPIHIEPPTTLPLHHKDPFDRLIAATALVEGLTLVSSDAAFDAYGLARLW
jgi:PIN domain nuclease of toxin-antitoxin system